MDFARKQLEKYGWSDGKGLGKHENGISEALKPKLKRSVTGVGHDPALEFNEHWWSALYDKAAKNVEVEEKNGKTKKIKTKDSENFVITSSTWKINKKQSKHTDEAQYSEYFVRTAVLTNDKGGRKTENVKESESESEGDIDDKKNVFKMTDEELFAACEGRTAHKGARHGLRALGKLARIAEQEKMLLTQPQYEGYSHAKKLKKQADESIDQMTITEDIPQVQKRKKKRKRCSNENVQLVESECSLPLPKEKLKSKKNRDASEDKNFDNGSNSEEPMTVCCDEVSNDVDGRKSKKKKKRKNEDKQTEDLKIIDAREVTESKKKKKKKKDMDELMDCC